MIEWDHRARYGLDYDTWYLGAHMREWMDRDTMRALESCWATSSAESARVALSASIALFDRLSTQTAVALGIDPFNSAPVRSEIHRILDVK